MKKAAGLRCRINGFQNPFRSTYFACLSMAAEMSTGVLAMAHLYKKHSSCFYAGCEGKNQFILKKAVGHHFTCNDGRLFRQAIERVYRPVNPELCRRNLSALMGQGSSG